MNDSSTTWLPGWFSAPRRVGLPTGHHLRPARAVDGSAAAGTDDSIRYTLLDEEERVVLGGVCLSPPASSDAGVQIRWWVVAELVGSEVERALAVVVPEWVRRDWPFELPGPS